MADDHELTPDQRGCLLHTPPCVPWFLSAWTRFLLGCAVVGCALGAAFPAGAYGPVEGVVLPVAAVWISPGTRIQTVVDAQPPGTVYVLAGGLHRQQQVLPKHGDRFIGAPGARLDGSAVLLGAIRRDGRFVFEAQTPRPGNTRHGVCRQDFPLCDRPLALFLDGKPLRAVARLAETAPGTWYFDEDQNHIYVAEDPAGRLVELTVTPFAFGGNARGVIVENLIVEKYASGNQRGAINDQGAGTDWIILNNEVAWNYGYGITLGSGGQALGNRVHHNGQLGIGGGNARGLRVEGNEIAFNAWNGTDCEWECGGAKWGAVSNLVVRGNHAHGNGGVGLWTDVDCRDVLYVGNRIEGNARAGISHETSFKAVIRDNWLLGNGREGFPWGWNAQIQVQNSSDVAVLGNRVELDPVRGGNGIVLIQQDRGPGYELRNIEVAGNTLVMRGGDGTLAGWFADFDADKVASASIRFADNRYYVFSLAASNDAWSNNAPMTFRAWQGAGFDVQGFATSTLP